MFSNLSLQEGEVIAYRLAVTPKEAEASLLEMGVDPSDLDASRRYFGALAVSLDSHLDFIFTKHGQLGRSRTRFTDGSIPVLYTAMASETAQAEMLHWLPKDGAEFVFQLIAIDFCGRYKNLLQLEVMPAHLTGEPEDGAYEACLAVTLAATSERLDAFQTPSARHLSGICFPILTRVSVHLLRPIGRISFRRDAVGQWAAAAV